MHTWPNEVEEGCLCCPGIVRKPIRGTSSHSTRQGLLAHSRLSSPNLCGLILNVKEKNCYAWADLHVSKKKKKKSSDGDSCDEPCPIIVAYEANSIRKHSILLSKHQQLSRLSLRRPPSPNPTLQHVTDCQTKVRQHSPCGHYNPFWKLLLICRGSKSAAESSPLWSCLQNKRRKGKLGKAGTVINEIRHKTLPLVLCCYVILLLVGFPSPSNIAWPLFAAVSGPSRTYRGELKCVPALPWPERKKKSAADIDRRFPFSLSLSFSLSLHARALETTLINFFYWLSHQ